MTARGDDRAIRNKEAHHAVGGKYAIAQRSVSGVNSVGRVGIVVDLDELVAGPTWTTKSEFTNDSRGISGVSWGYEKENCSTSY